MSGEATLRLLIADDHALVREGVRRLIEEQPDMEVVAEAGDGDLAVRLAAERSPDVALVDVSMPVRDGVEVTRMMRSAAPGVKVIALTRHDDPAFVRLLLEAGAVGYVLKQSASSELTRAIREVAAGERYVDDAIRSRVSIGSEPREEASTPVLDAELTAEEEAVLRRIALGETHGHIAAALSMEVEQVLAHRASGTAKARLSSRVAIMRYAQARGWLP